MRTGANSSTMATSPDQISGLQHNVNSLPETTYSWLRESILSGALPPGTELRQERIAKKFGVSRVPIREAMSRLQAEGLVELRPRRGFAVTSLDLAQIVEIFELRMAIEEHALMTATVLRSERDVAEVQAILNNMRRLDRKHSDYLPRWAELNRQYHMRLISSANRSRLAKIASNLSDAVEPYVRIESHLTGEVEQAELQHLAIFEAFRQGDAERAGRLSRDHCVSTMYRLIGNIKNKQ
jgi:DNA-binding GntR family transcriptional regulator